MIFEEYDNELSFKENLLGWFHDLIAYLIYDREWSWLHLLLSSLCTLEVYIPLLKDKALKHYVDCADIVFVSEGQKESYADAFIPKNTFYCDDCIYKTHSRLADFFFGYQSTGFCYYIRRGDFSFLKGTDLLWDGCKCCGRFTDMVEDDMTEEEYLEHAKEVMDGKKD